MNAYSFSDRSVTCPICHRAGRMKPGDLFGGLYTCPHCQARLVISWSGHYVRDPFSFDGVAVARVLRRQSSPLARIMRDLGLTRRPGAIAIVTGILVAGMTWATLEGWVPKYNPFQYLLESSSQEIE